jgi:hypothetical protein
MLPSVKTLEKAFPGCGKELRKVLEMKRSQLAQHPAGAARIAGCYYDVNTHDLRMYVLNSVAETCGVEYIAHKEDTYTEAYGFDYLNVGDPYTPTIIRFSDGRYRVACYGDIVERDSAYV